MSAGGLLRGLLAAGAAAAPAAPDLPNDAPHRPDQPDSYQRQQRVIERLHHSSDPTWNTSVATIQATVHCSATTPTVCQVERNSRFTVAMAATQGV